jgi:hypothetical protein
MYAGGPWTVWVVLSTLGTMPILFAREPGEISHNIGGLGSTRVRRNAARRCLTQTVIPTEAEPLGWLVTRNESDFKPTVKEIVNPWNSDPA